MSLLKRQPHRIVEDPQYGYRRLEPKPSAEELESFYRSQYAALVKAGGRAPYLKRFLQGGREAQMELAWLGQTLWKDIREILEEHLSGRQGRCLLDVGCGSGHFGSSMGQAGWRVRGVEPSAEEAEIARSLHLEVFPSLEELRRSPQAAVSFDAVTLLNLLEHTQDPAQILQSIRPFMKPHAIWVIRVPNDFSLLQEGARRALGKEPWWVVAPDHINYFNFKSLGALLQKVGLEIVDSLGDFPMEFFLLLGEDYIGNPETGARCHQRRIAFESALPADLRRRLYRSFAKGGIGRNCLIFARITSVS